MKTLLREPETAMSVPVVRKGLLQEMIVIQELEQRAVSIADLLHREMAKNFGPGGRTILVDEDKNRKFEICHGICPFSGM